MIVQDISHNVRISKLARLARELEQCRTLEQTFETLQRAFEVDGSVISLLVSTAGLVAGQYRVLRSGRADESRGASALDGDPDIVHAGGTLAQIIARAQPQLIQDVNWAPDPYFRKTLRGYSSVMAVPLKGNRFPRSWVLMLKQPPDAFTESDLEDAVERASLGSAVLESQLLAAELERANERIDRDARQVGELQRALLPASLPRGAGLEIVASYEPSGRARGDLYDVFPLNDSDSRGNDGTAHARWCALIGDASGHGLAAAIVMAIVQAVLHAHPARVDGPAALLAHANRQLCEKRLGGFFTAFLAVYEPASRRLTYANAGHPPPLLKHSSDGSLQLLDAASSIPLGIEDDETFAEATLRLRREDLVLLYTDGITEARRGRDDLFGQDRLTRFVREASGGSAELIERLRAAVRAHEHGQPAIDDQTLVAARVL